MERKKLSGEEIESALADLNDWEVENDNLKKHFEFGNFSEALAFVNRVGAIAERLDHHPDVLFGWGYAEIDIYTHAIDGLTESDFILAAKIDTL